MGLAQSGGIVTGHCILRIGPLNKVVTKSKTKLGGRLLSECHSSLTRPDMHTDLYDLNSNCLEYIWTLQLGFVVYKVTCM